MVAQGSKWSYSIGCTLLLLSWMNAQNEWRKPGIQRVFNPQPHDRGACPEPLCYSHCPNVTCSAMLQVLTESRCFYMHLSHLLKSSIFSNTVSLSSPTSVSLRRGDHSISFATLQSTDKAISWTTDIQMARRDVGGNIRSRNPPLRSSNLMGQKNALKTSLWTNTMELEKEGDWENFRATKTSPNDFHRGEILKLRWWFTKFLK